MMGAPQTALPSLCQPHERTLPPLVGRPVPLRGSACPHQRVGLPPSEGRPAPLLFSPLSPLSPSPSPSSYLQDR